MKRKVSRLRSSPNEEARIIREELERRRKLRIQQVREQQREIASHICREVERRRQQELRRSEEQSREEWEQEQKKKLQTSQSLYQENLRLLGQSHRSAKENEPDSAAVAQREEEHHAKAEERYREASKELKTQKVKQQERQKRSINARKKASQAEKERSAKVASLPPPPPDPIQDVAPKKPHVVKRSDSNVFAATHYHMPENAVEKEVETQQPDAREEADSEARRLQDRQREEQRRREEQSEKARLRGRQALRREQSVQDRERLSVQSEHMQQTDSSRRRQEASQMPPQIFQPLYRRQETREDFQREMEFAFEDMYTGERRVKGDSVVQSVPEPLPASSSAGQDEDQESDITSDENGDPEAENIQDEVDDGSGSCEQEAPAVQTAASESSRSPPKRASRKLLDRIRSQRNDWINGTSPVPAGESPSVSTERDTTIETGSSTPTALHEPTVPPQTVEPTEPSPAAEPPAVCLSRTKEVEERRKREAESEMEKQEQMALLRVSEEQKAKSEQMSQEAQQEREQSKAAVTQQEQLLQPQAPVQDQVHTSSASEGGPQYQRSEEESIRRLREYQRRSSEQNRIHQRSVEVARQRLEEHQRALQLRHNMAALFMRPPAPPPAPLRVPLTPPAPSDDLNEPKAASSSGVGLNQSASDTQRPDVTARLTDSILEKVTRHLPERLRPPSALGSSRTSLASDSIQAPGADIPHSDPRRRELQEAQRRVMEQREAVASQEKLQEEKRRRAEEESQQMRSQKEASQASMDADQRSSSDAPAERLGSEDVGQKRSESSASSSRAIEESNGGSLSHSEEPEAGDDSLQQAQPDHEGRVQRCVFEAPSVPSAVSPEPPRLLRPPPEPSGLLRPPPEPPGLLRPPPEPPRLLRPPPEPPRLLRPPPEPSGLLRPPPEPSGLLHPPPASRPPVTRVRLGLREMMPEQHELSAISEVETPVNISRATGPEDDVPLHPADVDSQKASGWLEALDGTVQSQSVCSGGPDSDQSRVSSETSGNPPWRERSSSAAGTCPERSESDSAVEVKSALGTRSERGVDSPVVSTSRSPSEPLGRPAESDYHSSTTISSGSYVSTEPEQNVNAADDPQPSKPAGPGLSPGPQTLVTKENSVSVPPAPSVDTVFNDSSIQRIIDRYTRELDLSLSAAGTTTDSEGQSSEDTGSSVSQQPSVGSSRVGDEASAGRQDISEMMSPNRPVERVSPGYPSSNDDPEQDSFRPLRFQSTDQSSCLAPREEHSVLEQSVGQPSAHSSMIGPRPRTPASSSSDPGGWDSAVSRMIGRSSSQPGARWLSPVSDIDAGRTTPRWMDDSQEESRMRPSVGESDDSVDPHSGSSGVTETRRLCHGEGVSAALAVSHESIVPSQSAPLPETSGHSPSVPHAASSVESDSHRAEDSFHPSSPEITHNETTDPSMTFQLPEQSSASGGVSTTSTEDDPSPERLRREEPSCCGVLQESLSQSVISQCPPQESVLSSSPASKTESCVLSDETPVLSTSETGMSEDSVPVREDHHENQQEQTSEEGRGRGILEQSQITLVSSTDTTLQDPITSDEEGLQDCMKDGHGSTETKGAKSTWLPEEAAGRNSRSSASYHESQQHMTTHVLHFVRPQCPASVSELQTSPSGDSRDVFQRKRQALIQRSQRRVQDIKAKRSVRSKETYGKQPVRVQSVACWEETTPGCQSESEGRGGTAGRKLLLPGQVSGSSLPAGVPLSASEQRRRNQSEMHERTRRLYEQSEEVKQQRAVRSRQEDGAKNRSKAKEFHRKTLQKLRAQQSRR